MKAFLMYRDRDFDLQGKLPSNEQVLTQDLELNTLFNAMALGDEFLFEVAKRAVLSSLNDLGTILYRQNILKDCMRNPSIVRSIYDMAVESIETKKKRYFGILSRYPSGILYSSIEMLNLFVVMLKRLKDIVDEHAGKFESDGFMAFFAMLNKELGDEFFASVQNHLKELKFREGVLISAELGNDNKGANYVLRKSQDKTHSWIKRMFANKPPVYTFCISNRDESGARALSELHDRGINLVANTLAQSTDHILSFFNMLRTELAFYIGCLNLHGQLAEKLGAMSFPVPVAPDERRHSFKGLYDVCLALSLEQRIVGNDLNADNKYLVIITGANQGGKSTFLRSIGLSQLMMQCGMFVPAESLCSNVCDGVISHYKREEDAMMNSGKLDEELSRMSNIADNITSNSMLLFNESFAATNEREGSEIARQIICALLENRIKVFFVTHLYEFAHGFYGGKMANASFLRAERQTDGGRSFKIIEGEPLQTSYGEDLYDRIFGREN
ncbi:MAG TPA: DNA mismatch repair protein MutS [Spirochaetia bacterium]|nr:DNA mismatch repair protein MutS [Spirochaetia bacterium]